MMRKFGWQMAAISLALLAAMTPATAQKVDDVQPDTRITQGVDPGTTSLNQEQAQRAAQMDNNNVQNAEVYRRQLEEHNRAVAEAAAARAAYEADLARNNAQTAAYAQQRAAFDAAMARWRADVAACEAGNRSRCGTQQPRQ